MSGRGQDIGGNLVLVFDYLVQNQAHFGPVLFLYVIMDEVNGTAYEYPCVVFKFLGQRIARGEPFHTASLLNCKSGLRVNP